MATRHWTAVAGALACALTLSACQQKPTPTPSASASGPSSSTPSAMPSDSAKPAPSVITTQAGGTLRPVNVCTMGDSITEAPDGRHVAYDAAEKAGLNIKWVGARDDGKYKFSAWGGITIGPNPSKADAWLDGKGNLYARAEEALTGDPDLCTIEVGTNDNFNDLGLPGYQPNGPEGLKRYADMLDHMHSISPKTHFLAGTVLPVQWDVAGYMKDFNAGLKDVVATRPWASVADLAKDVNFTDADFNADRLHPANNGWTKYGDALFKNINAYLTTKKWTEGIPSAEGTDSTTPTTPAGSNETDGSNDTDGSKVTSALLLANGKGDHAGWMLGVPHNYSWARGPETNYKFPEADSCLGWGQGYLDEAGPKASNTRVEFKDIEIWALSKSQGKWKRIAGPSAPDINAYPVDFHGDAKGADLAKGSDGTQQAKVADNGFNLHFWAQGGSTDCDLSDTAAITSFFQTRGMVDDPSKPADIDAAKILVSAGLDYRRGGATGSIVDSLGLGKALHVTKDWRYRTVSNATKEQLDAHPFPAS